MSSMVAPWSVRLVAVATPSQAQAPSRPTARCYDFNFVVLIIQEENGELDCGQSEYRFG
jgi:hypothetical protein